MGILSIWIIAVAIAIRCKRGVEEVALFGISLVSFIYLIMGTLGILSAGTVIALVITAVSALFCLWKLVRNTGKTFSIIFSIGSLALFFYIAFFVVTYRGCGFYHADNLTYWGINLKYLYNTSKIRTATGNFTCIHPEGLLVWDYYILKTWVGYTESLPSAFHCLIDVVLMLPFLRYANGRYKYLKGIALWILVLTMPCIAYGGYSSLLGDVPLAFSFAYCILALCNYLKAFDRIYVFQMLSGIYLMVSTKRGGIIVAACFVFMLAFALFQKKYDDAYDSKKKIAIFCAFIIEIILVNSLWIARIDVINVLTIMGTSIVGWVFAKVCDNWEKIPRKDEICSIVVIICVAFLSWFIKGFLIKDLYTTRIVSNYFSFLLTSESFYGGISVLQLLAIFSVIIFILNIKYSNTRDNRIRGMIGIGCIISILIFLFVYLVLYVKDIGPANGDLGPFMPSFPRYMAPVVYAMILYIYFLVLDIWANNKDVAVFITCITSVLFISVIFSIIFIKVEPVRFYGFEQAGIELTEEDHLLVVLCEIKNDNGTEWPGSFKYDMAPAATDDIFDFLGVNPKSENIEDWPTQLEFERAIAEADIDYIYVQHFTDDFYKLYGDLFPGLDDFHSGMVYKVNHAENAIQFVLQ